MGAVGDRGCKFAVGGFVSFAVVFVADSTYIHTYIHTYTDYAQGSRPPSRSVPDDARVWNRDHGILCRAASRGLQSPSRPN